MFCFARTDVMRGENSEQLRVQLPEITKRKSVSHGCCHVAKAHHCNCIFLIKPDGSIEPSGLRPCQFPYQQTQVAQP